VTLEAALTARRPERSGRRDEPPIRLLVVDDSSVARAVLTRMVAGQPDLQVAATAGSVAEALRVLAGLTVDIILLDIEMPGATGLEGLPAITAAGRGARVLIVSSMAETGAEATIRALSLGATDTLPKPGSGTFGGRFSEILLDRLRRIGRLGSLREAGPANPAAPPVLRRLHDWQPACIAIGASTGGIHAINDFLLGLPAETGMPILITQHLPPVFMPYFARQLATTTGRNVQVAEPGARLEPDQILVAPGTAHLRVDRRATAVRVRLDPDPAPSGCLPSVDPMLDSLADAYGPGGVAVMLSGMGRDGVIGSRRLVEKGGVVLAQDQASCAVWGMPRAVCEAGLVSAVLPPRALAEHVAVNATEGAWR
jgi:two-component system, chemotaxis family, protein-glutamate methylesterase/glutaminase